MNRLLRFATNRWLLAILAVLLSYTLAGFWAVPFLIRHYAPQIAAEQAKLQVSLGEVKFNPFIFTFEARDLSVKEEDGRPVFGLGRLFVDFDLDSLTQKAWVFGDLSLDSPALEVVLEKDGRLNLARIAGSIPQSQPPQPPPPPGPPPRLLLKRLALTGGLVKYTNQPDATSETLSPIDWELKSISTLPESKGAYTFGAKLSDGGELQWSGSFSLEPIHSEGELHLDGVRLALPWKFARERLNLAEPGGAIALSARYRFSHATDHIDLKIDNFSLGMDKLRLALAGATQPLLTLEKIRLDRGEFNLAERTVKLPAFSIENGSVEVAMDDQGALNWQSLMKTGPAQPQAAATKPSPPPSQGAAEPPWRVETGAIKLADIAVRYADSSLGLPYLASVGKFGLELTASAEVGAGEPKARIDGLKVSIKDIDLSEGGKSATLARWDGLEIEGGRFDLEKREAGLARAVLKGGGMNVVRESDGGIRLAKVLTPKETKSAAPAPAKPGDVKPSTPQWRFSLGSFALQGFHLAGSDRTFSPEIAYEAESLDVTLDNISNDGKTPVSFDARIKFKRGGSFAASGKAAPTGTTADARMVVDKFDLIPLQALVSQFAALKLEDGDLSANLQVGFRQNDKGPAIKATGTLGVGDLLLKEAVSKDRFLSWKKLSLAGVEFGLQPDRLAIKEARFQEPGVKFAIAKDHSTNFADIFKTPPKPGPGKTDEKLRKGQTPVKPAAKSPSPAAKSKQDDFPVKVERVLVNDGIVDFSDMSLVIPFGTHVHDFDGTVNDLSTSPKARTNLKFTGRVEQYGEAKVDGALNLASIKSNSDIKVIFRNVEMTSLSPYSATFAGRKISSGKLNLDLNYKIENSQLKSENKITLDQFTLGEQVESPKATNLPLDLAIALLKDGEGKINATIPIEGNVDNPQFAYGKLVWDAFVTLIKTAATAPFRAIGSIFGVGGGEEFGAVLFPAGSDDIPPPEREKLQKIAKIMAERPQVKLTVHGGFDAKQDGEALRSLRVRQAVTLKLGETVDANKDPGPLSFSSYGTQKALESLASERGGQNFLDPTQADFEKTNGRKPKRVLGVASLLGASEDQDFYQKAYLRLVETQPLPQTELDNLGKRRGQAVVKDLSGQPGFDSTRLSAGKIEPAAEVKSGGVPTQLELGAKE